MAEYIVYCDNISVFHIECEQTIDKGLHALTKAWGIEVDPFLEGTHSLKAFSNHAIVEAIISQQVQSLYK